MSKFNDGADERWTRLSADLKEEAMLNDKLDKQLAASRLLLEECAAELRALEWSGPVVTFLGEGTFSTCPECGASQRKGHIPKCPYASLLRRLSET